MPLVNGSLVAPSEGALSTAFLLLHPITPMLDHVLLKPLARLGYPALGLNARSVNNQAAIRTENVLLDIDAGVRHLRGLGFSRVVLLGFSLGGSAMALYQGQAERPGAAPNLRGSALGAQLALAPADALVLAAAPVGPGHVMSIFLDPSVRDEADPANRDPSLDMFDPRHGPPYAEDWLRAYRAAQLERNHRISAFARERLDEGEDVAFVVHRTAADPRFLDLALDPSDRPAGAGFGDAAALNAGSMFFGRLVTARSWLDFWSHEDTHFHGPRHLAVASAPCLFIVNTADQVCFTGDQDGYFTELPDGRVTKVDIRGAGHTLVGQPDLAAETATRITTWLEEHPA